MITRSTEELQKQIGELKKELVSLRRSLPPQPVEDFPFETPDGPVRLSQLFGDKSDLLLIHNMGGSCNYCTLWADGYSGYLRHIEERAAFVVVSPDSIENQQKLSSARNWKFRMVRDGDKQFSEAMGYWSEKDGWWPGISAFHKNEDGTIVRTASDIFGPGDDYCLVWPMFDLLKNGSNDWEPH